MRARRAARAAWPLLLALATARPAQAGLPDWVQAIADSAPALPAEASSQASRVLLSETRIVVQADGLVRHRRRFAAQALNVRTSDVSTGFFAFDEATHVTSTLAWHLPPGEDRARRDRSVPIDWTHDDVFLSDNRVRIKTIDGVRKGSLVFFEFEAAGRPPFLSLQHLFYEGAPIALDRFQVQLPEGWTLRSAWTHSPGFAPAVAANTWTWEMRDLPVAPRPPLSDDPVDVAPRLFVQPVPAAPAAKGPAAFTDWTSLSTWYESLTRDRDAVTPAIRSAAVTQSPGEQAAFLDRVRAAALFVRDAVRYTAIELGIGGYQPRPAADTLVNLYGDCKDKGTLFRALLKAQGIPSFPVLVYLGDVDQVPEAAAWAFNHYVVAVPVPEGPAPERALPALFDGGSAGRMLIVDTTDERTAFGSISAALGGHRALLVDGAAGRLITLPEAGPDVSVIARRLAVEVAADRSRVLRCEVRRRGEPAAAARSEQARGSLDRRRRVEARLMARWPDAELSDYAVVPENQDGEFEERIVVKLHPARPDAGEMAGRLFPWLGEEVPDLSLARRTVDVVFPHPMTVVDETTVRGAFAEPPAASSMKGDGWSVNVSYQADGETLKARAEVSLARRRFPPAAFPELKRFWSAVESAAGRPIPTSGG